MFGQLEKEKTEKEKKNSEIRNNFFSFSFGWEEFYVFGRKEKRTGSNLYNHKTDADVFQKVYFI